MKASELRIGNLVKNQSGELKDIPIGEPVAITADSFMWAEFYVPIELTPEWLERMDLQIGGYGVSFDIDGGYLYNETSLSGALCNRMNFSQIQYVHQLQNLFFSLTGKELEIKQLELA